MSYLARLKTLLAEKRLPEELTELTKGASVSFVSDQGGRFSGNEAVERIRAYPCPDGFSPARWQRLQDEAARFAEEWGARAVALGWTEAELFALAEPFARVDIQGAAWFMGGSNVAAVTADAIMLRTESGATLRIYRRGSNSNGRRAYHPACERERER
jgi:hypothetical protein